MSVRVRIRHRANVSENIEARHQAVMRSLSLIDELWKGGCESTSIKLEFGETGASGELSKYLNFGYKGSIAYSLRDSYYLEDKAMYDDSLILDIDTNKINYCEFVKYIFPKLVEIMNSYRATIILDGDLDIEDYDKIIDISDKSDKDIDGRDTVYRINSVNYYDQELCRRAFGMSPKEMVDRLNEKVESVSLLSDGVLLIYSYNLLEHDELKKIDKKIRELLG